MLQRERGGVKVVSHSARISSAKKGKKGKNNFAVGKICQSPAEFGDIFDWKSQPCSVLNQGFSVLTGPREDDDYDDTDDDDDEVCLTPM